LAYLVMGIGVNVRQASFPDEIALSATSLLIETGKSVSPDVFLEPLLKRLERWYRTAIAHPNQVIAQWERLSSYARGCHVRVESLEGVIEGITRGLAASGALLVEIASGENREIVSGEVTLRAIGAPT